MVPRSCEDGVGFNKEIGIPQTHRTVTHLCKVSSRDWRCSEMDTRGPHCSYTDLQNTNQMRCIVFRHQRVLLEKGFTQDCTTAVCWKTMTQKEMPTEGAFQNDSKGLIQLPDLDSKPYGYIVL